MRSEKQRFPKITKKTVSTTCITQNTLEAIAKENLYISKLTHFVVERYESSRFFIIIFRNQ